MNLLQRLVGKRDIRAQTPPFTSAPPRIGSILAHSGASVGIAEAAGIPAAGAAMRLKAGLVGSLPIKVYRGDGAEREVARDTWQYELLHDRPHPEFSPFVFKQDLSTSLDTTGNAFIWKVKMRRGGRVDQLVPLDPRWVTVRTDENTGQRLYDVTNGKQIVRVDNRTILHIRGWTPYPGAPIGMNPIEAYRHALGHAIAKDEYVGRFFANDARPGGLIMLPSETDADDAREVLEVWDENHAGAENANKVGVLFNGAQWHNAVFNPKDTQFIESQRLDREAMALIFGVPPSLLYLTLQGQDVSAATEALRFEKFDLGRWLSNIISEVRRDEDLWGGTDLFPEFITEALVKPDLKTRYEAYRLARQGGWITANEIREKENFPPHEGGDEIQETPVGGAPNTGGSENEGESASEDKDKLKDA